MSQTPTPAEIDAEFRARSAAVSLELVAFAIAAGGRNSPRKIMVDADPEDPDGGRIEDRKFYITIDETAYKPGTGLIVGVRPQRYRLLLEPVEAPGETAPG